MGLGQTMLTSAFLVLLTVAAMNVNKMIVDRDADFYEQEAYREAGKLANALIAEIMRKKFDEVVDTSASGYLATTSFTTSGNLGTDTYLDSTKIFIWWFYNYYPEPNKVPLPDVLTNPNIPNFKSIDNRYYDDVDDYDGYTRTAQSGNLTGFELSVKVYYVTGTNLDVETTTRTYFKRIDVTVSNTNYLKKSLKFSSVVAY